MVLEYDINVYNREKFIQAQDELLGEECNYQLCAFGTLKERSAFRMLCKLDSNISMAQQSYIVEKISAYENDLKYADEDDKSWIKIENYIVDPNMLDVYNKSQRYQGIVMDIKGSPCSWAIANDNLMEIFGLCRAPNGDILLNIEGKRIEDFGYLKMDWLIVDAVGIIDRVYREIGIPIPTSNELNKLIYHDEATWNIYYNGITCCVNQIENPKTRAKCMKYKPSTIEELCAFIASIRPSFASNYDKFEKRVEFSYGIPEVDNLLRGKFLSGSWLLYQEQIMQILRFCGFEAKETYVIMKAISKKKEDVIKSVEDRFRTQMKEHLSSYDAQLVEDTINSLWQVILDASSYAFNASHSYAMAHDSLWIAYAKAHYPQQTYTALIDYFTEKRKLDKTQLLKQEAELYFNIHVKDRKFGQDNRKIHVEDGTIYQSLASVKYLNSDIGGLLYQIKDTDKKGLDLYLQLKEIGLTKTHIDVLCKINYFEENDKLRWLNDNYKEIKRLSKDKIVSLLNECNLQDRPKIMSILIAMATKETAKQLQYDDPTTVFKVLYDYITVEPLSSLAQYYWQIYLLGEIINNSDTEYKFGYVRKYNSFKGSILLEDIMTSDLKWHIGSKDQNISENDIIAYTINQDRKSNFNIFIDLSKLFK